MSMQIFGVNEDSSKQRTGEASVYSALIQEAMRYDKLSSTNYALVMSILRALVQGYTEVQWQEGQQRTLKTLINQPTDPTITHADLADRYEQTINYLKDLSLWPW